MAAVLFLLLIVGAGALAVFFTKAEFERVAAMTPEEREDYQDKALTTLHGATNPQLVCPHCQTKGKVRAKSVHQKKGISGGKATAALLTGGVSILATGLSRKENATAAHCDNCNSNWVF